MGDLDAPGVPDGPEDRLLVVPPDPADLDVAVAAEGAGRSGRVPAVHEDQLEQVFLPEPCLRFTDAPAPQRAMAPLRYCTWDGDRSPGSFG